MLPSVALCCTVKSLHTAFLTNSWILHNRGSTPNFFVLLLSLSKKSKSFSLSTGGGNLIKGPKIIFKKPKIAQTKIVRAGNPPLKVSEKALLM